MHSSTQIKYFKLIAIFTGVSFVSFLGSFLTVKSLGLEESAIALYMSLDRDFPQISISL